MPRRTPRKRNLEGIELFEALKQQCEYSYVEGLSSPCLLYPGLKDKDGYSKIQYHGSPKRGHRLTWKLVHSKEAEQQLNHKCNRRNCIQPDHLYEGTQAQNGQDIINFGNLKYGNTHGSSKLRDFQVIEIKNKLNQGNYTYKELAIQYNISMSCIGHIATERLWKHIKIK